MYTGRRVILAAYHNAIKKVHSAIDFQIPLSNQNKGINLHIGPTCTKDFRGFKVGKVAKVKILKVTNYN